MKYLSSLLGFALVAILDVTAAGEPRPDLVAQVAAGKVTEAHASWWGFDPADSTAYLQAALRSGVRRLIIDKMPSPWVVTPLTGASDQELVFATGAEIVAKPSAFRDKKDCLLRYPQCHNVTISGYGGILRMRHRDYQQPPYEPSEWRHALAFLSCSNVVVRGLTIASSGGDGIYLGCTGATCRKNVDVVIRDVLCDDNHRQGISVISAENLLIENTVLRDTYGTAPAAGIDFEPNGPDEVLKNCVMRNCQAVNNQGAGFDAYLGQLASTSTLVDIRLENCTAYGNRKSLVFSCNSRRGGDVGGRFTLDHCLFEKPRTDTAVDLHESRGGVLTYDIRDSRIVQTNAAGEDVVVLMDEAWRKIHLPHGADPDFAVPHVLSPDWTHAVIQDNAPGQMVSLSPLRARRAANYVVYADAPRVLHFSGRLVRVGRHPPAKKPIVVTALDGKVVAKIPLPGRKKTNFSFAAPAAGFYRLAVNVGPTAFEMAAADAPIALDATAVGQAVYASVAKLWLAVPSQTSTLAVYVSGESGEKIRATLASPAGDVVWNQDNIDQWEKYVVRKDIAPGLWCLSLARPSKGAFEDNRIDIAGIPNLLFLNPARTWCCR